MSSHMVERLSVCFVHHAWEEREADNGPRVGCCHPAQLLAHVARVALGGTMGQSRETVNSGCGRTWKAEALLQWTHT